MAAATLLWPWLWPPPSPGAPISGEGMLVVAGHRGMLVGHILPVKR